MSGPSGTRITQSQTTKNSKQQAKKISLPTEDVHSNMNDSATGAGSIGRAREISPHSIDQHNVNGLTQEQLHGLGFQQFYQSSLVSSNMPMQQ